MVTPGVAFDLSVNRESSAFIGSILVAEVSRRLVFMEVEFMAGTGVLPKGLTLQNRGKTMATRNQNMTRSHTDTPLLLSV